MSILHQIGEIQNYNNFKVDTLCSDTQREFFSLEHIVHYFFHNEILSDIECRKITSTSRLGEKRAAIYQIIVHKKPEVAKDILEIFRSNFHTLHNIKDLTRIFSFLNRKDVTNCRLVCQKWKVAVDFLLDNYSEIKFLSFRQNNLEDEINKLNQILQELLEKTKQNAIKNSNPEIIELQASVIQMMLTMNPANHEVAFEAFRKTINVEPNSQVSLNAESSTEDNEKSNLIVNTLQIDAVLNEIFGFFALNDIKSCRIVCRHWNSIAEPFLHKKGRIQFTPSFRPPNYTNTFKYLLPDLPFTAFKFQTDLFGVAEMNNFFSVWGQNVENLHMFDVNLKTGISICLSHTIHLTELHLQGTNTSKISDVSTELMVPWDKLLFTKILHLERMIVNVNTNQRVRPSDVNLNDIQFFFNGGERKNIVLNDVTDFSKAKYINIVKCCKQRQIFDWTYDDIDADTITVDGIYFANSPHKAKIRSLNLTHCTHTVH